VLGDFVDVALEHALKILEGTRVEQLQAEAGEYRRIAIA
jgi:hypothetical protein